MIAAMIAAAALAAADPEFPHAPRPPSGGLIGLFKFNDYPQAALKAGEQGSVLVRLAVGTDGKPTQCVVIDSSESVSLDEVTCRLFMARAKFKPAHDAAGQPVEGHWKQRVNWMLMDGTTALRASWQADLDGQGKPVQCRMVDSSYKTVEDCAAILPVIRAAWAVMKPGPLPASSTVGFVEKFMPGKRKPLSPSFEGVGSVEAHDSMKIEIAPDGSVARCSFDSMLPQTVARRCKPPSSFTGAKGRNGSRLFEEAHFSRTIWVAAQSEQ